MGVIQKREFKTFKEFYPFYLVKHSKGWTKKLHFIGTFFAICIWIYAIVTRQWLFIPLGLAVGYFFAWSSHFFIQKNIPATFQNPILGFRGDFYLFYELLTRKRDFQDEKIDQI
ncbi:MAG: hypothetical protein COW00_17400 [Bdellovibrio sp. CG12_big_fil_rev_8_21_14_0_65_39_13]|nr:MAG: hypothetical protein COW78_06535 [Bdellovibrio sp. CG22_combo_CG10-13_8_21_14_all_39_27]PIQ58056.1 MAG: hypothetical protein COW00_17400 [Bdellovibrio sp. CG12_big_fil_rev_8_21_14_0_65_39_13]PIR32932.1 MAG: hypothetical protein COV37_17705 [Bdellovibrio sp. CG11_big_fil_rev_8_21_14_0_20_39_38]PJB54430.1 MAG: DUF962 domain-containing protein [Bdellovibrio sp. CG_4_9_14_3_um_filter_39_7]